MSEKKFYRYHQNNSGGFYRGPQDIYVEASFPDVADIIAQQYGVYFDGRGDCVECCGYRWSHASDRDTASPLEIATILNSPGRSVLVVKGQVG